MNLDKESESKISFSGGGGVGRWLGEGYEHTNRENYHSCTGHIVKTCFVITVQYYDNITKGIQVMEQT